jgi:hypothetical protein
MPQTRQKSLSRDQGHALKLGCVKEGTKMNVGSLRMFAVGLGVIGFVACSGSKGNNNSESEQNSGSSSGNTLNGNSGGNSGSTSAGNSSGGTSANNPPPVTAAPPPVIEAGACPSTCTADTDCASCGSPSDGGVYCCGAGTCYPSVSACDDDAGAGGFGDGSMAAPAPSM